MHRVICFVAYRWWRPLLVSRLHSLARRSRVRLQVIRLFSILMPMFSFQGHGHLDASATIGCMRKVII